MANCSLGTLLGPSGYVGASMRAESPDLGIFQVSNRTQEFYRTIVAFKRMGPKPRSISPDDKQFLIANRISSVFDVASLATWSKVIDGIVKLVSVDMVGNNVVFLSSPSIEPIDSDTAYVAGMRPRPDLLEQNKSMFENVSAFICKRMALPVKCAVSFRRLFSRRTTGYSSALLGAEFPDKAWGSGVFSPACVAISIHNRILKYTRGRSQLG